MAVLFVAVMAHAQYVKAHTTTREAATNMARAGAQALDEDVLYLEGGEAFSQELARQAVYRLATRYPELEVVSIQVQDDRIEVTVSEQVEAVTGVTKTISSTGSAALVTPD